MNVERDCVLRGGATVTVRPLRPQEAAGLRALRGRCSAPSGN
ncbi:hypothetical protein [Streptacidiphilus sp. P02-A3a]|nr:hypothetical protein [Streptacidiphilus sp. P02-A3a]